MNDDARARIAAVREGLGASVERRMVRVLRMLELIQTEPRQWNRERFCEHFGKSPRQIDVDIKLLRDAGYDIKRPAPNRGYEIPTGSENGDGAVAGS